MALLTNINGKFSVSDAGAVTFNNAFTFPTADGTANYVLKTNGSGQLAWAADNDGGGDITGSGTANTVTKFTGAKVIGDGPITFSSNDSTFAGNGTFSTVLNVIAPDNGGSPATTAVINMHGYDGRGVGIKMKDNVTTSGGGTDREWFIGTGYNTTGFNIGYSSSGSQTSYPAQRKLFIYPGGNIDMGNINMTDARFRIMGANSGTNPAATAHMASAVILQNAQGSDGSFSGIDFHNSSDLVDSRIVGIHTNHSFRYGELAFLTHNGSSLAEKMRISRDGYVGIGTTSPAYKLSVEGSASDDWISRIYNTNTLGGGLLVRTDATGSNNKLAFAVHADSGYKMAVRSTGNVGIGTLSPSSKLHVVGANDTTAVKIDFPSADFDFSANSTSGYTTKFHMDNTGTYIGSNSAGRALIFQTNDTDRLYINGNTGNVGIGTTSPGSKLEVNVSDDTFNDIDVLKLRRTWSTASGSDRAHGISFNDANAVNAAIYADRTNSGSNYNSDLVFITNTGASGTNTSEKMRITSGGNVGIGTTSPLVRLQLERTVSNATSRQAPVNLIYLTSAHPSLGYTGFGTAITHYSRTYQNSTKTEQSKIAFTQQGDSSSTAGSTIDFYTKTLSTGSAAPDLRMRIDYNGNVGIGTEVTNIVVTGKGLGIQNIGQDTTASMRLTGHNATGNPGVATYTELKHYGEHLRFGINHNGGTDAITINSSKNVGIGNTSPDAFLHIGGAPAISAEALIVRGNANGQYAVSIEQDNSSGFGMVIDTDSTDSSDPAFKVQNPNGSLLDVRSDGNVGIGTTSPTTTLSVQGTTNNGINVIGVGTTANRCYVGLNSSNHGQLFVTGSSGQNPSLISSAGANSYISGGNFGIGTTSPTYKLHVASSNNVSIFEDTSNASGAAFIVFNRPSVFSMGSITRNGSANSVSYNTGSDYRLKEDLKDFNALDLVNNITAYNYKWKDVEQRDYGFIAHELKQTLPNVVTGEKDGEKMQGVDYSKLTPILLKAIQEQQEIINDLKSRIEQLEN